MIFGASMLRLQKAITLIAVSFCLAGCLSLKWRRQKRKRERIARESQLTVLPTALALAYFKNISAAKSNDSVTLRKLKVL